MFRSLVVVGAPKCGTTSLHHYLGQHPRIFVPERKELHFFSQPDVKKTYYPVDFVESEDEYFECFGDAGDDQICGDFSPSYLAHPRAASRIRKAFSEVLVVVCLRDPVERAISHYLMDRRMGLIDAELMEVLNSPKDHPLHFREYVRMGEYAGDLERFKTVFEDDEIRVVLFPALVKQTERVVRELTEFLGLGEFVIDDLQARNVYREPRSAGLIALGRRGGGKLAWKMVRRFIPPSVLDRILYTGKKPQFEAEKQWLKNYFADDWEATGRWLKAHPSVVIDLIDE